MHERDAKLESYDVESVLNFAEHVLLNAARLWMELASDSKQRLQKVLFPHGVAFAEGNYKTAETCLFFRLLQQSDGEKTGLATLTGIEPDYSKNGFYAKHPYKPLYNVGKCVFNEMAITNQNEPKRKIFVRNCSE
jgi:hypothetical protein